MRNLPISTAATVCLKECFSIVFSHLPFSHYSIWMCTTANINAYFHDTALPGCFAGWQVGSLQTCQPEKENAVESQSIAFAAFTI